MSPTTGRWLRGLRNPRLSTQAGTRSWRPCRPRPAPLVRSTSWLKLSGTCNRTFKHSVSTMEIWMHFTKPATKTRRGAKGFGGKGKGEKDQTALSTAAAGIAVLEQGAASRTKTREARTKETKEMARGSKLRAKVKAPTKSPGGDGGSRAQGVSGKAEAGLPCWCVFQCTVTPPWRAMERTNRTFGRIAAYDESCHRDEGRSTALQVPRATTRWDASLGVAKHQLQRWACLFW